MQTHRRQAPKHHLSIPQLAHAYEARKRRTLAEQSFDPSGRLAIEAALGRSIDQMEERTIRGARSRGDRVAVEMINGKLRVWPIEIGIPMEQAARREAIHRYGAVVVDEDGNWHGMSPGAAFHAFMEQPTHEVRPVEARATVRPAVASVARARQSHGASHGSSTNRGGDSGDDSSPGSSGDGDGASERAPTLVDAARAVGCRLRDDRPQRVCACGCLTSIDHRAKQARWEKGHQQASDEAEKRLADEQPGQQPLPMVSASRHGRIAAIKAELRTIAAAQADLEALRGERRRFNTCPVSGRGVRFADRGLVLSEPRHEELEAEYRRNAAALYDSIRGAKSRIAHELRSADRLTFATSAWLGLPKVTEPTTKFASEVRDIVAPRRAEPTVEPHQGGSFRRQRPSKTPRIPTGDRRRQAAAAALKETETERLAWLARPFSRPGTIVELASVQRAAAPIGFAFDQRLAA